MRKVLISAKALYDNKSQGIFKLFTIKKRSITLVDVLVLEYTHFPGTLGTVKLTKR